MAGIYGKPLTVTNHSYYTANGTVSDHASGHAADIGMAANAGTNDGPVGDQIMTACLIAAGTDPIQAARDGSRGGLYTLEPDGLRIQCIWKPTKAAITTTTSTLEPDQARELALPRQARPCTARMPTNGPGRRRSNRPNSYWKPGQYTSFAGAEREQSFDCRFAGEHTSIDFQGYLNGGVESGERAADEIVADLRT